MKSKVLEKIWIILAALGIGVSLFINNSNKLIESNASNFSNAIISKSKLIQSRKWLFFYIIKKNMKWT